MDQTLEYIGTHIQQRNNVDAPLFFTFYADVKEIIQWAGVRRTEDHEHGTQRVIKPARRAAITRFLKADSKNTLPGSIIIGFNPHAIVIEDIQDPDVSNRCASSSKLGKLTITFNPDEPIHNKPGLIVDGQHRVFGCAEFEDENLPILVVGIVDADIEEQAFQFIVINQKSSKVPTTNVKSIIADISTIEDNLINRLETAGIRYGDNTPTLKRLNNDESSPFYKLLDWEINERDPAAERIITITAIETCIKKLQLSFDPLLNDVESAESVFSSIWSTLKKLYANLWNSSADNKFLKKVNMIAINEYVGHELLMSWAKEDVDPLEETELEEFVLGIFSNISSDYWTSDWRVQVQDNANVRELIKKDLEQMLINRKLGRDWKQKLGMISQ